MKQKVAYYVNAFAWDIEVPLCVTLDRQLAEEKKEEYLEMLGDWDAWAGDYISPEGWDVPIKDEGKRYARFVKFFQAACPHLSTTFLDCSYVTIEEVPFLEREL